MDPSAAFKPNGITTLNVTGIKLANDQTSGGIFQYELMNPTAATVAVAWGSVSAAATQTAAVVPANGASSVPNVTILLASMGKVISAPPGQFWASSAAGVYVTPGEGV